MTIVSKSGYRRNYVVNSAGGVAGSSYVGFEGPYYYQGTSLIGPVYFDKVYCTWQSDTTWKTFRRANGYLPTRPMTTRRMSFVQKPVTMYVTQWTDGPIYSKTPNAVWNNVGLNPSVLQANWSNSGVNHGAVVKAKANCLSKARDLKFSAPIFLAEGRKTVQMIAETARTLAKAYAAFKKGNFGSIPGLLGIGGAKGPANNWLAYQYGWSPLLADLKGLAELAAQQLELGGRKPRFKVYGVKKESGVVYKYIAPNDGHESVNIGGYTESTYICGAPEITGKAWLLLEVEYSDAALASQLGFGGFTDIFSVAWELVPFSFVFDWFINVGQTLENMSALKGLKVLDGGCSLQQYSTLLKYCSRPAYYSNYSFSSRNAGPRLEGIDSYYQRFTWNGDTTGRYSIRGWDALGAQRIISAVSLALQR